MIYGSSTPSLPSRFIDDIPEELKVNGNDMLPPTSAPETAETKAPIKVKTGDWVEHKHFGPGKVILVDKLEIIAAFQKFGIKRLAKNLAPIKKIEAPTEFIA